MPEYIVPEGKIMSKQHPECPLYNHATCKELHNAKFCAIIREDKICLKKRQKSKKSDASDIDYKGNTK